jgi:probable HAF family extracellular repeat protein
MILRTDLDVKLYSSTPAAWAVLAVAAMIPQLARAQVYSVTDLGPISDLEGQTLSAVAGINKAGQVVASNVSRGAYRALLYNGSWQDLGTLGGSESFASGINDAGQVVGYSTTAGGSTRAFIWTPGGADGVSGNPQMKDIGSVSGGNGDVFGYGINAAGQIAGSAQVGAATHAFISSKGSMVDLGPLLGNLPNSYAYSINDLGHIAGTAYDASYSSPYAFFYDGATVVQVTNGDRSGSNGSAINNLDHIAGYYITNSVDHAFRSIAGTLTDLGTLGGHYSYANAINDSDVVVGGSFVDSNDSIYHAFTCSGTNMVDLNKRMDASGSGWTLVEARGINGAGQVVGIGTYNGSSHIFLLNPGLRIVGVQSVSPNVVFSFATSKQAKYSIQTSQTLAPGTWTDLTTGLVGTGGTLTITNSSPTSRLKSFYRVRLDSP